MVRKDQRIRLPAPPGKEPPAWRFESLDYPASNRRMEAFYAEFPVDAQSSDPHQHGSAEFIYVLSGRLAIKGNGREEALDAGDAMYFDSSIPHSYRRVGGKLHSLDCDA